MHSHVSSHSHSHPHARTHAPTPTAAQPTHTRACPHARTHTRLSRHANALPKLQDHVAAAAVGVADQLHKRSNEKPWRQPAVGSSQKRRGGSASGGLKPPARRPGRTEQGRAGRGRAGQDGTEQAAHLRRPAGARLGGAWGRRGVLPQPLGVDPALAEVRIALSKRRDARARPCAASARVGCGGLGY